MEPLTAIYEDGVFRPLEPVDLPEHTEVKIQVVEPLPTLRRRKLSFVGIFHSGQPDLGERVEEIMEQTSFDRREGWSLPTQPDTSTPPVE